jgi:hypothetical protein
MGYFVPWAVLYYTGGGDIYIDNLGNPPLKLAKNKGLSRGEGKNPRKN